MIIFRKVCDSAGSHTAHLRAGIHPRLRGAAVGFYCTKLDDRPPSFTPVVEQLEQHLNTPETTRTYMTK